MARHILVVDSHDSFVYNLVELLRSTGLCTYDVYYAEVCGALDLASYSGILLSPGPGLPDEVEGLMELISRAYLSHSILGVCLGHQAIAMFLGGKLRRMEHPLHGHMERLDFVQGVSHTPIFDAFPPEGQVGRYHSWVVDEVSLPTSLQVVAYAKHDGTIMALRHRSLPIYGVQFHPESYLSSSAPLLIHNWIESLPDLNRP